MNELISDEAVYRTAPATPGLLNILETDNSPKTTNFRRWKIQILKKMLF
jgi:hypothetical protein